MTSAHEMRALVNSCCMLDPLRVGCCRIPRRAVRGVASHDAVRRQHPLQIFSFSLDTTSWAHRCMDTNRGSDLCCMAIAKAGRR